MKDIILQIHSYDRYFVLFALVAVLVRSVPGWLTNRPFTNFDDKLSLYLVIFTHIQFVVGIILYFMSDLVQFNSDTMKNAGIRYWTVEHVFGMVIAVALITAARSTSKRMTVDMDKYRRLAIFNAIALIIIVGVLAMSDRRIL